MTPHRPLVGTAPDVSRRAVLTRVLPALVVAPTVLSACSTPGAGADSGPDPLIAMADAARADAALAEAAVAGDSALRKQLEPLRAARAAHAVALDAVLGRVPPSGSASAAPTRRAPAGSDTPGIDEVHEALTASGRAAADLAMTLSAERVGLVASIAACCAAYAAIL